MTLHYPAENVVSFLDGRTVNDRELEAGVNLFACKPKVGPAFPTSCVFVWAGPGAPPLPYMGTPAQQGSMFRSTIQVRVRGELDDDTECRRTAIAMRNLLHRAQVTDYISALVLQSEPIDLGDATSGAPSYGLNVSLPYHEAPAALVYYGAEIVGAITEAFVESLFTDTATTTRAGSFTISSTAPERIIWAAPTSMGTPSFSVNGYTGGFTQVGTVDVTDAADVTRSYQVWASDNTITASGLVVTVS